MDAWDSEFYDQKSDVQFKLGLKTIDELNVQDGEKVLDIGCGTGRLTVEIAKKNPLGIVIGLDNNPDMIEKANANRKLSGLKNLQFIIGDILQYELETQFDAIFSNSALHWVQETHNLFQRIYNILAPCGRLVAQMATVGSLDHFIPIFLTSLEILNLSKYFKNWKYPIKLISPTLLQKILSLVGFNDINLWVINHKLIFKTSEALLDFLKTAPLVPILSQLPIEQRELYCNYIFNFFKSKNVSEHSATLKRLFLNAKK
ncbi:MAG: class I SAM-dependent methyltransferase [Promethearchaeota archaeon]